MPEPRPLRERDFESASALLADAFFDNPAHVYQLPGEERRRRTLAWFLRRNLAARAPLVHSFCVAEGADQEIVAMGFWNPPGTPAVSRIGLLRPSFLTVALRCGFDSTRRLLEVVRGLDRARQTVLGTRPAWYLNNMAVAKHLRGAGVGSALLERELRDRIDPTGRPALLATQRPENVVFYRRLGFEVALESRIGSRSGAFQNWMMLREPRG